MGRRSFASAVAVAAGLLVLALPAASRAQTGPSPSSAHPTPAYLRTLVARGDKECIQPPRHFDLKTLSDAQLALYGLPARHILESDPGYWGHMLAHYKHRACGPDIVMPRSRHPKPHAVTGNPDITGSGSNWAGNEAVGARGTYRQAQVTFNVPYISGNIGADVDLWAGVGGDGTVTQSDELVQDGVSVVQCPTGYSGAQCVSADNNGTLPKSASGTWRYNYAWYEIVNDSSSGCPANINNCNFVIMSGISIYPGNSMSAYLESNVANDGYDYFDVCNNTSSTCTNPVYNYNSDSFSDSATGECIGEESVLTDKGSDYFAANFGTEQLTGCYIADNSGLGQGIQSWPHNYSWITDNAGYSLVTVGSISNTSDYPLYFCSTANTHNNICG